MGRGPIKKEGFFGVYVDAVVKHGRAFVVNAGTNIWSQTHVADISSAMGILVAEALAASPSSSSKLGWGKDGYYFVEAEELPFSTLAEGVAKMLLERGLIKTDEVDHLDAEAVGKIHPYAAIMWGSSGRSRAQKLRALGWKPVSLLREQTLGPMVEASTSSAQSS